jgi:soluble lytic murein transglycosylase-like protein
MMKPTDGHLPYRKFEFIVPMFFGCLGSLLLNAFLMKSANRVHSPVVESQVIADGLMKKNSAEAESVNFFSRNGTERRNLILELYRDAETRDWVIDFFSGVCASPEIVKVILATADSFNISPALAFALAWEESRLNPYAVNYHNRDGSIDRGLFQLNNHSFPRLETQAFFNLETNARNGMSHLRHCLDVGGSEIAALAMYNAGTNRVNSSGTPRSTLDYISRIMENRWKIEDLFWEQEALFQEQLGDFSEVAEMVSEHPRLVPLMPLAGLK